MRELVSLIGLPIFLLTMWTVFSPTPVVSRAAESSGGPAGQEAFLAQKCDLCHGAAAAGVPSRAKSEKMKGPDLSGLVIEDGDEIEGYLRKNSSRDGKEHKKEFKGSDEELQSILDWLTSLDTVAEGESGTEGP